MNRKYIDICLRSVQAACVIFILSFTLFPIESRWAEGDVWLAYAMPIVCMLGAITMFAINDMARMTWIDLLVAAWTAYIAARATIGNEWPCGTQLLQTASAILLYWTLRMLFGNINTVPDLLIAFCLMVCSCVEAVWGLTQMACGMSRHHLFPMTGSFLNPGPYSAFLMVGSVAGLAFWKQLGNMLNGLSGKWRYVAGICVKVCCLLPFVVLPATWSRAALVSLCLCALWICRNIYWRYRYVTWGTIALALTAFYYAKQGSADGRVAIWTASLMSWFHSPWLGVGIGGFRQACAEGMAEMWYNYPSSPLFISAGVTDYACNELVKVLVEQGVLGALLCVSLTSLVMYRLYKHSLHLFAIILSLIIFSMFSYPFESAPYRIIAVMIVAWSASCQSITHTDIGNKQQRFGNLLCAANIGTVVVFLAISVCSLIVAREIGRRKDADKEVSLFSSMHNAAFIKDYYELMPYAMDNPQFIFDFAKTLRDCGRYRDSNAVLRQGTHVSADPIFYVLMGNNYKDEKYYSLSEAAYMKAYAILPNRLYPLYQMMLLYDEIGDKTNCVAMAYRILLEKPKIESSATKEMRWKAKSLLCGGCGNDACKSTDTCTIYAKRLFIYK